MKKRLEENEYWVFYFFKEYIILIYLKDVLLFKLIVHLLRNKVLYLKFYWQSFILNSAIDLFPRNLTNLARTVISQNTLEQSSLSYVTAQKIKFSIKNFFSKYDQIFSVLRIWSHLLRKSLMGNFIFCAAIEFYAIFKFCWNLLRS